MVDIATAVPMGLTLEQSKLSRAVRSTRKQGVIDHTPDSFAHDLDGPPPERLVRCVKTLHSTPIRGAFRVLLGEGLDTSPRRREVAYQPLYLKLSGPPTLGCRIARHSCRDGAGIPRSPRNVPENWGQSGKYFPGRIDENAMPSRRPQALRGEKLIEYASPRWVPLSWLSRNDGRDYTSCVPGLATDRSRPQRRSVRGGVSEDWTLLVRSWEEE